MKIFNILYVNIDILIDIAGDTCCVKILSRHPLHGLDIAFTVYNIQMYCI